MYLQRFPLLHLLKPKDLHPRGFFLYAPRGYIQRPKDLTVGQTVASLGIDVGGSLASQAVGYSLAPFTLGGSLLIPLFGGIASNVAAQTTAEGRDLSEIQYGRAILSGVLNLIPGAAATKVARPIAREAVRGAAIGAGDITAQKIIDEKDFQPQRSFCLLVVLAEP